MVKTSSLSENTKIAKATLALAGKVGWGKITLASVAAHAKISVTELHKRFKTTSDIVALVAEEIDREALAEVNWPEHNKSANSPHDRLFEILMSRFDIMQVHRQAILSMATEARKDRGLARALACGTLDSVYRIMGRAEISHPPRPVVAAGLSAVFGYAYIIWRKDDSRDMEKTMAGLDRALRYASKAAAFLVPSN